MSVRINPPEFRYYQARNEHAMVHAAVAFAKTKNCLQAFGCTSSIGPGATNVVTGADLVIGIGTRYSDFTTSSKTAFELG